MDGMKYKLHQELKQNFVLQRLQEMGVTQSQEGKSLYDLSYDDLKMELVLATFRQIDAQHSSNGWF